MQMKLDTGAAVSPISYIQGETEPPSFKESRDTVEDLHRRGHHAKRAGGSQG